MFNFFKNNNEIKTNNSKASEIKELSELKKSIIDLRKIYDKLKESQIKNDLKKVILVSENIYKEVAKDSTKLNKVYKFNSYYIVTLIKVMNKYIELKSKKIINEDTKDLFIKIEDFVDKLKVSFDKLYESLFNDDVLDIDAEIKVMIQEMKF